MIWQVIDKDQGIYKITESHFAYHLTLKEHMEGIKKEGLIPQCGPNCKRVDDTSVGVHFCDSLYAMFDFWIMALYEERDKRGLELLRFNIKNRKFQELYPSIPNMPGDLILLDKVAPEDIECLQHTEEGIIYSRDSIWTPIKKYKIHK